MAHYNINNLFFIPYIFNRTSKAVMRGIFIILLILMQINVFSVPLFKYIDVLYHVIERLHCVYFNKLFF